jgi:anthranilate synthase component I
MPQPDFEAFAQLAQNYDYVPVFRRLLSDTLTPVSAFACLDRGGPACLFESVIGGEKVGRYSFLAADPIKRVFATGNELTVIQGDGKPVTQRVDDPLVALREHLVPTVAPIDSLPPFVGGAIGYAGYDVVRYTEHLPNAPQDDRGLPDLDFSFYHSLCIFDHVSKTITVITLAEGLGADAESSYAEAVERLDQITRRLAMPPKFELAEFLDSVVKTPADAAVADGAAVADHGHPYSPELAITSNFTRQSFTDAVRACVRYIHAGDIFQVVPSQRFSITTDVEPLEIYRRLRVINPSPFMFFVRTGDAVLVGCSPEIMCRVADRVVTVRPLAGTRRRGKTEAEDKALEQELLADPKERAEHVMLVDLGRNDVGRVAKFGTVELTEVMVVERYSHVMHISSEVQGVLRDELDAFDALKASLPAGTVSGAPKVRAMEIIDEIEPHRRGPYGGAVGYFDYRGNMDTCIALRTMVIKDGIIHVQAGCGVVADSDPEAEYEETVNKAIALIKAIEVTQAKSPQPALTSDG